VAAARRYVPPPQEWDERLIHNREASMRLAFHPYLHSRRLKQRLRFVEAPTLILWGKQDHILGAEHAEQWQARLPHAEVALITGAGHFPHVEQPEACLPKVMEFLRTISAKVGSPQTCVELIRRQRSEGKRGTRLAMFQFGSLPHALTMKNLALYGREVLPATMEECYETLCLCSVSCGVVFRGVSVGGPSSART
jgi:alpha/beta hydrolase fold